MSILGNGTALGGGPLDGSRFVRMAFLDESGVGSIRKDTHVVIGGVIVNADMQIPALQAYLRDMLGAMVPKGEKRPDHLHAKDIYWGTGEFPKDKWSEVLRFAILDELASIPKQFDLPVVWGAKCRQQFVNDHPGLKQGEELVSSYSIAAMVALIQIERYMRSETTDEVASVFFENNNQIAKRAKQSFRFLRKAEAASMGSVAGVQLPLRKIFDTPSYQDKNDASILQLADFCAFARKRCIQKLNGWERLWLPLHDNCVMLTNEELPG